VNHRNIGFLYTVGFGILFILFFCACVIAFYACSIEDKKQEHQIVERALESETATTDATYPALDRNVSSGEVIVEKVQLPAMEDTSFFLSVSDHYLVVLGSDQKTVFMETNILLEDIPMQYREQIMLGKRIESEQELYELLEAFSS